MKPFLKICFALSALVFLFSSCGKKNEAGKMIPSDALFVARINIKSLDQKLSWNDIKQTNWYKKLYADSATSPWKTKLLNDPSSSGIDFEEGLVFFGAKSGSGFYIAAEGKLKSEKDFEQFNKNFSSGASAAKDGDINLLTLKDNNIVGWKDDHFIYVMNTHVPSADNFRWEDSTGNGNQPSSMDIDLSAVCKKLFSLKADSSLAKNEKFATLLNQNGDIMVWQNTEAIIKSSPTMGMLGMMKLDAFIKDNVTAYTINFDKGKIDVDQKNYVSKELTGIIKKYMGKSINMDMIKNIPSQNVFGLLAFNFKPEGITEMIKLTGADGIVNSYAQKMGFTLDDFSKSSNGDGLLAFTDLKVKKDSAGMDNNDNPEFSRSAFPDFNFIFSTGIGDKTSLQKIINALETTSSQLGKDSLVNYVMNDKLFALANTRAFANQYLSGSSNNKYKFDDKISGHPVGFFLDIHQLLSQFSSMPSNGDNAKPMLDESLKTWDNIISYGGEYKDDGFAFHTEINLINKDTNSLKQLNHYFDRMSLLDDARKSQSTHRLDSLLVPPPVDTVNVK